MAADFYTFGEFLWDCLPSGRHAGGAPFNVAGHIAQLGGSAALISSVGRDALGDEILKLAEGKGVNTQFVSRARTGLVTGRSLVTLDVNSNASYEIVQPAAWDEIEVTDAALDAIARSRALLFGSLAVRSAHNLRALDRLLAVHGPVKFFDVNLRPPFVDPELVVDLAKRADVLKLNHDEVGLMAGWLRTGKLVPENMEDANKLAEACRALADATKTDRIWVTRGADGAALWDRGHLLSASAPKVAVKDTVGAGDAFMAGLVVGLARGLDVQTSLECACRLGAYVASHDGAIPSLPPELVGQFPAS